MEKWGNDEGMGQSSRGGFVPLEEELLDLLVVRAAAQRTEPDALLAVALGLQEDFAAVRAVFLG